MTDPDKSVAYKTNHGLLTGLLWWCVVAAGAALGYLSHAFEIPWLGLVAQGVAIVGVIGLVAFIAVEKFHLVSALARMWKNRKSR